MLRRLLSTSLMLALSLLIIIFSASQVLAWASYGTWQNGVTSLRYAHHFEDLPELYNAFNQARLDWYYTPTLITFVVDEYNPQIDGYGYSSSDGFDGFVWPSWSGGYISHANMWLNWYYLQGQSVNYRRGTAGHEWGHCFGLDETTGQVLMNPNRDRNTIYTPQSDDIDGINYLYPW